jgi:tRNA threonylcarbamoyl adenosine modification protein (Sua5/YciO/YrdC/YwlC family)
VAANAFDAAAVEVLQAAKGRGRDKPPPVLVGSLQVLDALATDLSDTARALAEAFWPGGLTLVARAQPALSWDLGETRGTVGLRMPDHPVALEVLRRFGPTAVTSANRTGELAPSRAPASSSAGPSRSTSTTARSAGEWPPPSST